MRAFLLLSLPALALAILAAHFYRAAAWALMLACLALIALLAVPRAWVARLVPLCLAAGTLEWIRTAYVLVQQRIALGQPWARLALVLGAVALFTAAAAWVFRSQRLRARFTQS
jgi:hypothetical protein